MVEKIKMFFKTVFFGVFCSIASFNAFAAEGPDLSALTGAISFGTVTTAILAVAGMLATVYVAIKGASLALSMLRK